MGKLHWMALLAVGALGIVACDDDGGGGSGDGGSAGSTSTSTSTSTSSGTGGGGGSDCPGAQDCTTYCTDFGTQVDALACPNADPFDVADCISTCETTFDYFEAAQACVCEYHASLACPLGDASCYECDNEGDWQTTEDCCTEEVTAVHDCAAAL